METPPVPKPRTMVPVSDAVELPVPLPRTKSHANNEKLSASDILRSIGTVSKQITEDVASKVSSSAKTANDMIEKSLNDGSKFAMGTIKKTINTSRAVRDSVTKSVIEGTKTTTIKLRKGKKTGTIDEGEAQRSASMPAVDMTLFDNIQFHSPLLEQKRYNTVEDGPTGDSAQFLSMNLNVNTFDDHSLFSSNSDSNTDTISNFSYDSKECDQSIISNMDVHNKTFDTPNSNNMDVHNIMYDTPKGSRANSIAGSMSLPDLPERRNKKKYDFMRQNSLYENWVLPVQTNSKVELENKITVVPRPSHSTIFEFDPLNSKTSSSNKFQGMSNELILLESFLVGDTYGTVVAADASDPQEDNFDFAETDYYNPPTPPERFDSLDDDGHKQPAAAAFSRDSNANWYVATETSQLETLQGIKEEAKPTNTMMQKFSRRLKLDSVLNKPIRNVTPKVEKVSQPAVNKLPVTHYSGILTKVVSPVMVEEIFKNTQTRYCMLSDQQFICYADPTSGVVKESYLLTNIYALQIVLPVSSSTNDSYCFELWVSTGGNKSAPRKVVFTCASVSERRNWAQKIAEHLTSSFLPKYYAEYTRMGWCYMKEGVTGEWYGAWLMLTRRVLLYTNRDSTVSTIDLRKTKCVVMQNADEEATKLCPSDGSSNLLLVCPSTTVYLRFPHEKLLKGWRYMLKLAAHNNGAYIHHQQLTQEDVPVIVDKCLSFIYAHGSLSEGIYRRAGGSCTLSELLARFRRDAWAVQLSIGHHTEHDVAGVLKRFLRDLPDTLIPLSQHKALLNAIGIGILYSIYKRNVLDGINVVSECDCPLYLLSIENFAVNGPPEVEGVSLPRVRHGSPLSQDNPDEGRRFAEYRRVMCSIPVVARNTARKLFAHLHFLQSMSHANKMNAENLASVWAPTIMPPAVTSNTVQTAWSSKEVFVVRDLIAHFESIWEPTETEKRREAAVRRVLMRVLSNSAPNAPKAAGDLKAWIYVKDRTTCHQVALTPSKTASDVCIELSEKANMESHLLMLEEVICNESMRRIIHIDEIVLDVVLRWGYWDEEDRKDSYLLVKDNGILHEMESLRHSNPLVCGELKLATESSKAFKLHMFEFQNGCLCYFKDKQGSHKIEEWNVKDMFWYIGHEPKRNPQSRWAITFIPRNKQKRSKEKPWFGVTIAGAVNEDRLKWMTAMTFGEHSNILPTPRLVIT